MKIQLPEVLSPRPAYGTTGAMIWTDPHIAKGLLEAHIDPSHDAASRKPETIASITAWILQETGIPAGAKVLDLGSGPGLYCACFAQAGLAVTGVDISANSLAWAKEQAELQGLDIRYLCGNYLELELKETFDLVTLIYFDFGVFLRPQQHQLLAKIAGLLLPEGWFAFDVHSPNLAYQEQEERDYVDGPGFWSPSPHWIATQTFHYPQEMAYLDQHTVVSQEGTVIYRTWEHYFTPELIKNMLAEHGFEAVQINEDLAGSPLSRESRAMGILARKL